MPMVHVLESTLAEFIDPSGVKVGLKAGYESYPLFYPTLKLALTTVQDLWIWLLDSTILDIRWGYFNLFSRLRHRVPYMFLFEYSIWHISLLLQFKVSYKQFSFKLNFFWSTINQRFALRKFTNLNSTDSTVVLWNLDSNKWTKIRICWTRIRIQTKIYDGQSPTWGGDGR